MHVNFGEEKIIKHDRYLSQIERKIAIKTWGILKATYLIALLHILNENTAYLFEISRCIKYLETRTKHLLCGIKGNVRTCTFD